MTREIDWSEQWGEWIIVENGVGRRFFFECRAEAEEYLRLTQEQDGSPYVWRSMDSWYRDHRHTYLCRPLWQRGDANAGAN